MSVGNSQQKMAGSLGVMLAVVVKLLWIVCDMVETFNQQS